MSIETVNITQHVMATDRRLESSVNSSLRSTSAALQTADNEPAEQEPMQVKQANVQKIVEQMQTISKMFDRKLQFQVNSELNDVIVKVIDSNTDKVIREIPSAEIQKLQIRIKETIGLLFDASI